MDLAFKKAISTPTFLFAAARKKDLGLDCHHSPMNVTATILQFMKGLLATLPVELLCESFGYCNVHDLVCLGQSSCTHGALVGNYIINCMKLTISCFFPDVEGFRKMLRSCDAIVSSSSALHILLPPKSTTWIPVDLDIYVASSQFHYLKLLLVGHGYHLLHEGNTNDNPNSFSFIHTVATFGNGTQQIDVIISNTANIGPIFQFHSTTVMNFFSADHIFCAYPDLTLRLLARINPGPLYFGRF